MQMPAEPELLRFAPAPSIRIAVTTQHARENSQFGSFNLATHVGDDLSAVTRNRTKLMQELKMSAQPVWLNQIHSNRVINVSETTKRDVADADASFTRLTKMPLSILTADCVPIVVWSDSALAVVHAGWKGLANGIVENVLKKFESKVSAWIGPCIGPCHYEVDDAVRVNFADHSAFSTTRPGHYRFDLPAEAEKQLRTLGVSHVEQCSNCTSCDPRFYSYRRDGITGRFATLAWRLP